MSKKIKYEEYGNYGKFIGGRMSGKSFLDDDELSPLEALENIKTLFIGSPIDLSKQFDIIETALIENDETQRELTNLKKALLRGDITNKWVNDYANQKNKKLKALEIIKEKVIPYSVWNRSMIERAFDEGWIIQEEYDLLKEVLI